MRIEYYEKCFIFLTLIVHLRMKEQVQLLHVSSSFPISDIQQYLTVFTLHENVQQ